jgi:IS5 family transposase
LPRAATSSNLSRYCKRSHRSAANADGRATKVYADRGYDHDKCRAHVRELTTTPVIARRSTEHGSGRGKVPVDSRALRKRWEIRDDTHEALLNLGCAPICWRRLQHTKS